MRNIRFRKVYFTSWNNTTSHKAWIRSFKSSLSLPFTPLTAIHYDGYMVTIAELIDLFTWLEDWCQVTSTNANCCWIWTIICRNHCKNVMSTWCCTLLQDLSRAHSLLRCTPISLFNSRDLQNNNWYIDWIQIEILVPSVCKVCGSPKGWNNF